MKLDKDCSLLGGPYLKYFTVRYSKKDTDVCFPLEMYQVNLII